MRVRAVKQIAVTFVTCITTAWTSTASAQVAGDALNRTEIPTLYSNTSFGSALAGYPDINGDGIEDMTVGAANYFNIRGLIWNYQLDGTVNPPAWQSSPPVVLDENDVFGCSVAFLGDLDGAGPSAYALAVGARGDDDPFNANPWHNAGAVYILFYDNNSQLMPGGVSHNGTDTHVKFSSGSGPFAPIDLDLFGYSVANIGDVNNDGVVDIAVGEPYSTGDGATFAGSVWIIFLNTDGTGQSIQKISSTQGNFTGILEASDFFGWSISGLGDLDGDTVPDIAVGAIKDDDGYSESGAVWILFLNSDGTVKSHQKISRTSGNFTDQFWGSFGY